jgi:hypothetical protein
MVPTKVLHNLDTGWKLVNVAYNAAKWELTLKLLAKL